MEEMFDTLLTLYPLPNGLEILPASQLPEPRAKLIMEETETITPLVPEEPATIYHDAIPIRNERVTAPGWYQDVRNVTFSFKDDLE
jgi:hypothetical protein